MLNDTLTPTNGWPDANGRMQHWLKLNDCWMLVVADKSVWFGTDGEPLSPGALETLVYHGPCLTPDEVSAREAAAAIAMREACAMIAEKRENGMAVWLEGSDIANAIRAWGSK